MSIKLDDLLRIPDSESSNVKVRFNQHDGHADPMDLYLRNGTPCQTATAIAIFLMTL